MSFPISTRGAIFAEQLSLPQAVTAVEAVIRGYEPNSISTAGARIDFTGGMFRLVSIFSMNLLSPISSGTVTFRQVDRGVEVQYDLSFRQLLIFVTAAVVVMFGIFPLLWMGPRGSVPIPVLGVAWLWLFGMNFLMTRYRFPAALRRGLAAVPR